MKKQKLFIQKSVLTRFNENKRLLDPPTGSVSSSEPCGANGTYL